MLLVLFSFLLAFGPGLQPLFIRAYLVLTLILWTMRYLEYVRIKFQYFMVDFCYFGNVVVLSYLFLFPESAFMFKLAFGVATGTLF